MFGKSSELAKHIAGNVSVVSFFDPACVVRGLTFPADNRRNRLRGPRPAYCALLAAQSNARNCCNIVWAYCPVKAVRCDPTSGPLRKTSGSVAASGESAKPDRTMNGHGLVTYDAG